MVKNVLLFVYAFVVTTAFMLILFNHFSSKQYSSENVIPLRVSTPSEVIDNTSTAYIPSSPTLDMIFSDDHSWVATLSAERMKTLLVTGDVIPARSVNIQTTRMDNFTWPFEKTAYFLKSADVTYINLETPLLANCPLFNSGFTFCGNNKNMEGLVFAGVDVANLANNHAGNFGTEGVRETIDLLNTNSILAAGVNDPVYKTVKDTKFAFLGYNDIGTQPGISEVHEEKITAEIKEAQQNADIVVVQFHWGTEYKSKPDKRQRELGKLAIDSGADLVIGNHPHWVQPVEFYNGKLITYAHGNFVFDQMWSEETKKGIIGNYVFYDTKLIDVEYFPVYIENFGQPHFFTNQKDAMIILQAMQKESIDLLQQ